MSKEKIAMSWRNWPYNPSSARKKPNSGGGGKELKKRAVWFEIGNDGKGVSLKRVMNPKGKKQRRGAFGPAESIK